jgi:shikimate dehydrogenase
MPADEPAGIRFPDTGSEERTAVRITGKTKIMFILCDPVDHVRGTDILNKRFEVLGEDVAMSPLHIYPGDLGQTVEAIRKMNNVAGFGVTIPHKIQVIPHLDRLTARARQVGSVNFVRREKDGTLVGDNVDGGGFIAGIAEAGISVAGKSVLQVGAGGAGRAVAFAIAEAGAARLAISNRTRSKAADLAGAVATAYPECVVEVGENDPDGFDVVVNATSAGMHEGDPLPVDPDRLSPGVTVAEIIIQPRMTPLLVEAEKRGHPISVGQSMLDGQFALMKEFVGIR